MGIRSSVSDLLILAQQAADEIRTIGDPERAETIVAMRAEIATQRFGHDLMGRRLADYFRAEVWRLARH